MLSWLWSHFRARTMLDTTMMQGVMLTPKIVTSAKKERMMRRLIRNERTILSVEIVTK